MEDIIISLSSEVRSDMSYRTGIMHKWHHMVWVSAVRYEICTFSSEQVLTYPMRFLKMSLYQG